MYPREATHKRLQRLREPRRSVLQIVVTHTLLGYSTRTLDATESHESQHPSTEKGDNMKPKRYSHTNRNEDGYCSVRDTKIRGPSLPYGRMDGTLTKMKGSDRYLEMVDTSSRLLLSTS